MANIDNRHASFSEESLFAEELRAYYAGRRDFVGLSTQIAEFLGKELGCQDKPASTDILVVDFEETPEMPAGDVDDEQAAAAFAGRAKRYLAVLLLESKQAYMHEVGRADDGSVRTRIARHYAILPNPSQKVASYAVVDLGAMTVLFCDKPRSISGEERLVVADGLLQCSPETSGKEVVDAAFRIVEEVAEEYGANAAVALSKAKAHVASRPTKTSIWRRGTWLPTCSTTSPCRSVSKRPWPKSICPNAWRSKRKSRSAWRRITRSAPTRASR